MEYYSAIKKNEIKPFAATCFPGGSAAKNPPVMQDLQEMQFLSLGRENPLEKEIATHSCLGNPMDRGDWWATVHRVAELDTTEAT